MGGVFTEWEYWKSAQPRARVRPMAERPLWPCHSVYRETARVERTISLLDFLTAPATISNTLWTTRVSLAKKWRHADTVIAHPPLPNSHNPAGAMLPPLLKHQKSTLLNRLSVSDHALSIPALPLHKSSGDQIVLPPKASPEQYIPQHPKATVEIAKRFMDAIIFTKTTWAVLSDNMYWMVDEAW